jgi:hypothetical protein
MRLHRVSDLLRYRLHAVAARLRTAAECTLGYTLFGLRTYRAPWVGSSAGRRSPVTAGREALTWSTYHVTDSQRDPGRAQRKVLDWVERVSDEQYPGTPGIE